MNRFEICTMIAMAALSTTPVMAQQHGHGHGHGHHGAPHQARPAGEKSEAHQKATDLAAHDSEAPLNEICYAVYLAVKENPDQADVVLSDVLAQRTNWSPGEVYAIFRAVLMAHPDVNAPLERHASGTEEETGSGEGTGAAAGAESTEGTAEGATGAEGTTGAGSVETPAASTGTTAPATSAAAATTAPVTMMDKLVTVLNQATLPAGTAQAVLQAAGVKNTGSSQSGSSDAESETEESDSGSSDSSSSDSGASDSSTSAEAGSSDAGSADSGSADGGAVSVGGSDPSSSGGIVSNMAQTNQDVLSGSMGGGVTNEETKEPVIPTPDDASPVK